MERQTLRLGLQEAAAKRFDEMLEPELTQIEDVGNCTSSAEIQQLSKYKNLWINLDYME